MESHSVDEVAVYITIMLFGLLGVAIWAGRNATASRFWTNDRKTSASQLIFTIIATQIGGGAIIGIASSTYAYGTGYGVGALLNTSVGFLTLAYFAPKIKERSESMGFITMPGMLDVYFGKNARIIAAVILVGAYLAMLAGQMVAAATIFQEIFSLSFGASLFFFSFAVIAYTSFAGLRGDIITDGILFWFMTLFLFALLAPNFFNSIDLVQVLLEVPETHWSALTFGGYTYLGIGLLLGPVLAIVLAEMWMRIVAANGAETARKSFLYSSVVFIPFYVLPMLIGLAATQMELGDPTGDDLFMRVLTRTLPESLLGFGVAGLLAVIISTSNTVHLVIGETIYSDLLHKKGRGVRAINASRLTTLLAGLFALAFAYAIQDIVQLILSAFYVLVVLFPAIAVTFTRFEMTPRGAALSMILGAGVTLALLPVYPVHAVIPGITTAVLVCLIDIAWGTWRSPRS